MIRKFLAIAAAFFVASPAFAQFTNAGSFTAGGTSNQIQYYGSGGQFAGFTMSGDCTVVAATGVITCLQTNGTNFTSAATTAIGTSGATIPLLSTANTWTLAQTFPAPGASLGSIVLTPGTVSGTPPNGSLWTTSTGLFAQINGSPVGPYAIAGAATPGGSNTQIQYNNSGSLGGSGATTNSAGLITAESLDFLATTLGCTASTTGLHLTAAGVITACIAGSSVGTVTSTGLNAMAIGGTSISTGAFTTLSFSTIFKTNSGNTLINDSGLPTVTSGLGTSPAVTAVSTAYFYITVGASGTPSSAIVLGLPTSGVLHGWVCFADDLTTQTIVIRQSGSIGTGAASFTSYVATTGVATAPSLSDVIGFQCGAT